MSHAEPHASSPHAVEIMPAGASDSHGPGHHGHTIVSQRTLVTVLTALVVMTLMTVGATRLEMWVSSTFHVVLPQWINVVVALSIAVIKSALVVMFFMQLRYDNLINTLVLIFSLMAMASFLGFTMLDLGGRDTIARYKAQQIVPGGTGLAGGGPITVTAKNQAIQNNTYDPDAAHHGGHHDAHPDDHASSAQQARPRSGVTLPELGAPASDGHSDPAHADPAHADPAKPHAQPKSGAGGH